MAEIERALVDTEDFLVRQVGTRSGRAANALRLRRGVGEAMRRARRAGLIFVGLVLALIAADVAGLSVGFLWLIALPAFLFAALLSLTWPTRRARRRDAGPLPEEAIRTMPLEALVERFGQGLLDRCNELPRGALAPADRVLAQLEKLRPHLDQLSGPRGDEIRRLVGGHLPRLLEAFLALPSAARGPASENSVRIAASLGLVADELAEICGALDSCREASFAIEHRFIETRYKDGEL